MIHLDAIPYISVARCCPTSVTTVVFPTSPARMDPLSLTAATVGFLSFLGQLSTILSKIITADNDERKAIDELNAEIQYFTCILSELEQHLKELQLDQLPGHEVFDISELVECLKAGTAKLQAFVDKFKLPVTRWKELTRRFQWPLRDEERKRLINLVNKYKTFFQLALTIKQG